MLCPIQLSDRTPGVPAVKRTRLMRPASNVVHRRRRNTQTPTRTYADCKEGQAQFGVADTNAKVLRTYTGPDHEVNLVRRRRPMHI